MTTAILFFYLLATSFLVWGIFNRPICSRLCSRGSGINSIAALTPHDTPSKDEVLSTMPSPNPKPRASEPKEKC